jgi:hypothetical protein
LAAAATVVIEVPDNLVAKLVNSESFEHETKIGLPPELTKAAM